MPQKKVHFIATKYKDAPARVSFYTRDGKRVAADRVKSRQTRRGKTYYANMSAKK